MLYSHSKWMIESHLCRKIRTYVGIVIGKDVEWVMAFERDWNLWGGVWKGRVSWRWTSIFYSKYVCWFFCLFNESVFYLVITTLEWKINYEENKKSSLRGIYILKFAFLTHASVQEPPWLLPAGRPSLAPEALPWRFSHCLFTLGLLTSLKHVSISLPLSNLLPLCSLCMYATPAPSPDWNSAHASWPT